MLACLVVAAGLLGVTGAARASSSLGPLYVEPDQGYAPIIALIGSAKHSLDMTMYELADPDAEQALIADAARGVVVRVLLDRQYHGASVNTPARTELLSHGVQVQWASTRVGITHQKSFVIDGRKAVIMTGNLTSKYYATSRDFALVDRTRKDVQAIETTFQLDWTNTSGVAPAGADLVWSPGSQTTLVSLIASAKHSLLIENEEMASSAIVTALAQAAQRGVTVQVVMTRQSSWKANFDALKAAGVQIRTYKNSSTSLYIHAKLIDADGKHLFLGSENFSTGSMQRNRELGLTTSSRTIIHQIQTTFASDYANATPW